MRMIIDTDCGIDDAEALIMALTHPAVTVEAITTVVGNTSLENVNRNVCTVMQQVGKQVPVYSGADRPLIENWFDDERRYHQSDGLGDWEQRPPVEVQLESKHAALALVDLINQNPNELTLVALGPLTNVALAVRFDPTLPEKIKHLVVMGGAVDAHGNTPTVSAEFNIWIDPEAAHIVFEAFPELTLLSWETTTNHPISWEDHERLKQLGTPLAEFYAGINEKSEQKHRHALPGHWLPDPLAMAITLDPDLILEQEKRHVMVELQGKYTRGQTVVNYTRFATDKANTYIVRKVDMQGVLQLYEAMLSE